MIRSSVPAVCSLPLVFALLATGPASAAAPAAGSAPGVLPEDWHTLTRSTSYAEMQRFLTAVDGQGPVAVSVGATTAGGRSVFVVHLGRADKPAWKVLFYAQQHGDEVSGKDALLYLIRDIARRPELLPAGVDLWILPMVNPDGAEAGTRENGAGVDLNRDHLGLEQPETRALHAVADRVRPDVAVDCHEFGKDPESWRKRGWVKWPVITMDGGENPYFEPRVIAAGRRWVEEAATAEAAAGHGFLRYWVGGLPPDDEQRHSAPDIDSGMPSIGMYGGLSFIIEAAVPSSTEESAATLGTRVDAFLVLLRRFLADDGHRAEDLAAIAAGRARPLPEFLPVNYLWTNPDAEVTRFPVVDLDSHLRIEVPTANMMTRMTIKRTVPAPLGYVVAPRAAAALAPILERFGVPYERLDATRPVVVESCTLLRVETEFDEVYSRYEGRQIVRRNPAAPFDMPVGALWVPLAGEPARRAALLLEPASLYGLYQLPVFRALVDADGTVPVLRVTALPESDVH